MFIGSGKWKCDKCSSEMNLKNRLVFEERDYCSKCVNDAFSKLEKDLNTASPTSFTKLGLLNFYLDDNFQKILKKEDHDSILKEYESENPDSGLGYYEDAPQRYYVEFETDQGLMICQYGAY